MTLLQSLALIPVAKIGGKHAQHVALVVVARFTNGAGRIEASHADIRMATGLSRSTVQRAMAALIKRRVIVSKKGSLRFDITGVMWVPYRDKMSKGDRRTLDALNATNAILDDWTWGPTNWPDILTVQP